jgi:hypothetical protein
VLNAIAVFEDVPQECLQGCMRPLTCSIPNDLAFTYGVQCCGASALISSPVSVPASACVRLAAQKKRQARGHPAMHVADSAEMLGAPGR